MSQTSKGLTLIELLISILLISAMLGAIWAIYHTGQSVFYSQYSRENIKSEAANAFYTMTNELHQAISITAATETSLTIKIDLNNDGIIETVIYSWSGVAGAPLNRNDGTNTRKLVRSVNNTVGNLDPTKNLFCYYGTSNASLGSSPSVSQVKLVAINLYTYDTSGSERFHLRTKVQLRCI